MKLCLKLAFVFSIGGLLVACGSKPASNGSHSAEEVPASALPPGVTQPRQPQAISATPLSWRLFYHSDCPSGTPEKCLGAYGFSIGSDGDYVIGPAPDGATLNGKLEDPELVALNALLAHDISRVDRPENCADAQNPPVDDLAHLKLHGTDALLFQTKQSRFCFHSSSRGSAESLHDAIRALLKKYYPDSFPSPCIEAADALEQTYAPIRRCEMDSDCVYLNDEFLPINDDREPLVEADDCSYVKPLFVANGFAAVSNQLDLLMKRELAREVCGDRAYRKECDKPTLLDPRLEAPVCMEGVCQAGEKLKNGPEPSKRRSS